MGIDAIIAIGGLVFPSIFDFVKKKFLKPSQDSPEATMSTLATAKPEVLPEYVKAMSEMIAARVKWYNRDVIGNVHAWVATFRASIRPVVICLAVLHIVASWAYEVPLDGGVRAFYVAIISEWFGERLTL